MKSKVEPAHHTARPPRRVVSSVHKDSEIIFAQSSHAPRICRARHSCLPVRATFQSPESKHGTGMSREPAGSKACPTSMVPMHAKKRKEASHASSEVPPGLGVRQSSGAFPRSCGVLKAAEGCRSPRRYRVHSRLVSIHGSNAHPELAIEAVHEPPCTSPGFGVWRRSEGQSRLSSEAVRHVGSEICSDQFKSNPLQSLGNLCSAIEQ